MDLLTLRRAIEDQLTRRAIQSIPKTYDKDKRTVSVVIATETPSTIFDWERWDYIDEILLMDGMELPEGRTQVPLLDAHDRWSVKSVLGSITNFRTAGGAKEADLTFASTEEAQKAETLVGEGHLTDLSAGYKPLESIYVPKGESTVVNGRKFDGPVKVTKRWLLKEGSLVPIGADVMSVVRSPEIIEELVARGLPRNATDQQVLEFLRELQNNNPPNNQKGVSTMLPKPGEERNTGDDIDVKVVESKAREAERTRLQEIDQIIERCVVKPSKEKVAELRSQAIKEGWTPDRFGRAMLEATPGTEKIELEDDENRESGILGMSPKELSRYSLVRAIRTIAEKGVLDGVEKEASIATAKVIKREASKGFFIPQDILRQPNTFEHDLRHLLNRHGIMYQRDLSAQTASKGGYLVGTQVMDMIELLRNLPILAQAGARVITGLKGNVAFPRQTGGGTAYWLGSNTTATNSDQTFGQLALTMKRLVGVTAYDKELVYQSTIDVENFVREDLMTVLAIEKDRAGINGAGGAEPLGIFNLPTGLNTITFGGAPTWADAVDFETQVASSNALLGRLAYVTTPSSKGKWKTTVKESGQAIYLWEGNEVNGYPAYATLQIPGNKMLFGNFSDLIMGDWAGIEVIVDTLSLKKKGQIELLVELHCDIGARHPGSFCVSTDAANQ